MCNFLRYFWHVQSDWRCQGPNLRALKELTNLANPHAACLRPCYKRFTSSNVRMDVLFVAFSETYTFSMIISM